MFSLDTSYITCDTLEWDFITIKILPNIVIVWLN